MNKDNIIKIAMIGAGLVSTILTTLNTERYIDKKISEKVDKAKEDIKNVWAIDLIETMNKEYDKLRSEE